VELENLLKEVCQQKGREDIHLQREGSLFWGVIHGQGNETSMVRNPDQIPGGHAQAYKDLYHRIRAHGVYLAPSAYEVGFLSTVHETEHLQQLATALSASLDEVQKGA
jgi:glutamate-1-semialdehyde 2,1-aminomutase